GIASGRHETAIAKGCKQRRAVAIQIGDLATPGGPGNQRETQIADVELEASLGNGFIPTVRADFYGHPWPRNPAFDLIAGKQAGYERRYFRFRMAEARGVQILFRCSHVHSLS